MDFSPSESALIDRLRCGPANFEFTNWAKTFRSRPRFFLSPETETEIIQLIHLANRHQLTIKPIGSGHSPSDLACTNSMMLDMSKMKRILSHDPYACTITVESGIRLHELHQVLKQRQMALSSVGAISDQSIAGAIATATHGTGMQFGDLSSMITHLVIIDGLGVRHQCSKAVEGDLFDAARCSLGALGVITQVTLQCEPMFTLHAVQVPDTLDHVLDDLPAVLQSAEHVRFWWFPHTDHTVVWRANRSSMAQRPDLGSFWRDRVYGFHYYQLQLFKARCSPGDIPRLTEEHFRNRFDRRTEWVDDGFKVFNMDCLFPQYVNEWAVPWENTAEALRQIRHWVNAQAQDPHGVRVHFPVEVRFVKESSVWLSPTYNRTVCYIGVIMYRPYHKSVPYKRYWKAYEDIMRTLGGRPHWAKAHKMFYFDLLESYPRFKDFVNMRERCDPRGIFVNEYIRRHILPPPDQIRPPGCCEENEESRMTMETPKL